MGCRCGVALEGLVADTPIRRGQEQTLGATPSLALEGEHVDLVVEYSALS